MSQVQIRRVQPGEARDVDTWITERHYRGCVPPGAVLRLEWILRGERIGAMMWGRPCARMLNADADHLLELTRMYFDGDGAISMTAALAQARKHIRSWFPQVKLLLSYADPQQGHEGIIYQADGWARFGKTTPKELGWANRDDRRDACGHSKIRFVRTP